MDMRTATLGTPAVVSDWLPETPEYNIFAPNTPHPPCGGRSHLETLIIHELGSRKLTTQNDIH